MVKQTKHIRVSKKGKKFVAGSKIKPSLPEISSLTSKEANIILQEEPEYIAKKYGLSSKYEAEDYQDKIIKHFSDEDEIAEYDD